jgi:hypothetical protein
VEVLGERDFQRLFSLPFLKVSMNLLNRIRANIAWWIMPAEIREALKLQERGLDLAVKFFEMMSNCQEEKPSQDDTRIH